MAAESGRKVSVGLGRETTRGTSVAPSYWLRHMEVDFQQKAEKQLNESGLGVLDKHNEAEVTKDIGGGGLGGKVCDRSFGLILCSAFGATPSSVQQGGTGVYDHTFAQSQSNTPVSLTVGIKDVNRDERYALSMLKSLEISLAVGDWVKFKADFVSKKPASASNTVSYVVENEFKAKHVTVKLASSYAGLGAASAIPLKDFKITADRGVEEYMAVGSNDPYDIFSKELEIKGDFTMLFDGTTHRDSYLNNTNQVMQLTLENTDVVIGSGSAHPKLVLNFYRCNISDWGLDQGLSNMVEQSIGFQSLYSISDGKSWDGVLSNTATSY